MAHDSHNVVVSRVITVHTLGENRSNVIPSHKDNSHKVDTGSVMCVTTHGINHINVMSVVHSSHEMIIIRHT